MSTDEVTISLQELTKIYPGTTDPAVESLNLDIKKGEVLVLVGPSGCGKSTTLRLINRMIEPTSGRIIFDGDDVTDVNPDRLRRKIGYVIQKVGLFPHRTIYNNVATVPRMAGWSRDAVRDRVHELLELTGLDPDTFSDRYPKELSGGQAQRVGVARALGADPSVMLMDEPFGAIDPITRERLQNEFLRLQADLAKTIVFVTHDIDEAIKMGDRIAILRDSSVVAQHDTPERILAFPADDFVADFLGSGATLKGLNFERVRDVSLDDYPTAGLDVSREQAQATMTEHYQPWLLLVDSDGRPSRWLHRNHLDESPGSPTNQLGTPVRATIEPQATLRDALEEMLLSSTGCVCVIDGRGRLQGTLDVESLTGVIARMQSEARSHYEQKQATGRGQRDGADHLKQNAEPAAPST